MIVERTERGMHRAGIALLAMLCACTGRIQPSASGAENTANGGGGGATGNVCVAGSAPGASTYVRKSFLTLDAGDQPSVWNVGVRVVSTTPPSELAGRERHFEARFNVTADKVQLVESGPNEPAGVVDAWPAANIDLDGGCEGPVNQTEDWELRQWIDWDFDKKDVSDLDALFAPPPTDPLLPCLEDATGATAALVTGSFSADGAAKTLEWGETVSLQASCPDLPVGPLSVALQFSLTEE